MNTGKEFSKVSLVNDMLLISKFSFFIDAIALQPYAVVVVEVLLPITIDYLKPWSAGSVPYLMK